MILIISIHFVHFDFVLGFQFMSDPLPSPSIKHDDHGPQSAFGLIFGPEYVFALILPFDCTCFICSFVGDLTLGFLFFMF